jgi:hypothetical protein
VERNRKVIPVMQTKIGEDHGNCFEACMASILEIPIYRVPDFPRDDTEFIQALEDFLLQYGLFYLQVETNDPVMKVAFKRGDAWHVIEGTSERGGPHACVGLNGKLVHDPHPGGHGLVDTDCFGLLVSRARGGM